MEGLLDCGLSASWENKSSAQAMVICGLWTCRGSGRGAVPDGGEKIRGKREWSLTWQCISSGNHLRAKQADVAAFVLELAIVVQQAQAGCSHVFLLVRVPVRARAYAAACPRS
eukprot:2534351-Pleurochrysis_carterae.AAC.1